MANVTGKLLVSNPGMLDPNFDRTIVLVCLHDEAGAFGLVLNRPSVADVAEHLADWLPLVAQPPVVFRGGPVEPSSVIALGMRIDGADPVEGPRLPLGLGIVDLRAGPGAARDAWRDVRFFSGYAGWGGGQLDGELEAGAWFVSEAGPDDALTTDPAGLWARVVRRVPQLAMYTHLPPDPRAN